MRFGSKAHPGFGGRALDVDPTDEEECVALRWRARELSEDVSELMLEVVVKRRWRSSPAIRLRAAVDAGRPSPSSPTTSTMT